jgi:hypothetical protein
VSERRSITGDTLPCLRGSFAPREDARRSR